MWTRRDLISSFLSGLALLGLADLVLDEGPAETRDDGDDFFGSGQMFSTEETYSSSTFLSSTTYASTLNREAPSTTRYFQNLYIVCDDDLIVRNDDHFEGCFVDVPWERRVDATQITTTCYFVNSQIVGRPPPGQPKILVNSHALLNGFEPPSLVLCSPSSLFEPTLA